MMTRVLRSLTALVLLGLSTAGCGGGSSSSAGGSSSKGSVSAADAKVLTRMDSYVTDYNNASNPWSTAYKRGNRAAFLRVQYGYTSKMNVASKRFQLAVIDIREPALHNLMRGLGKAYAAETAAIVEADNAVINDDQRAGERAIQHLQTAAQRKIDAIDQLAQRFPAFFQRP